MTNATLSSSDAAQLAHKAEASKMRDANRSDTDYLLGAWLFGVAFLVLCMVIVGGATRLTDSGLSITQWAPIKGAIPPLSAQDWANEFARYRAIPEYIQQNKGMSLSDFQFIYWWEWSHRLLGRLVGLAFGLPFLVFLVMGRIKASLVPRLVGMLLLGGLQGAIGWWMVKSGLSGDRLDVAAYRLATHLSMAFVLLALLTWTALDLVAPKPMGQGDQSQVGGIGVLVVLLASQIVMGAFVAGTDAGMVYNDWPTFAGQWFPKDYAALQPFAHNLVENRATIQFNHRIGAYVIAGVTILLWLKSRTSTDAGVRLWGRVVAGLVVLQVLLGIVTLVGYGIWTPPAMKGVILGICHQTLGAILWTAGCLWLRAALLRRERPSRVEAALA